MSKNRLFVNHHFLGYTRKIRKKAKKYFLPQLYDKQKIMYDGNIEYDFLTFSDRKLAEKRAKELNRKN